MMWLLVIAYISCCLLFCITFIANILESDLRMWSLRASASFIQMVGVFPLAQACAAHRLYYQCLQDEGIMEELRRTLHLEGARRAWEEPSPARQAPQQPQLPGPPSHAEPLPPNLRVLGNDVEEEPSPPSSAALRPSSHS